MLPISRATLLVLPLLGAACGEADSAAAPLDPQAESLLLEAKQAMRLGDSKAALASLEGAVEREPRLFEAQLLLGKTRIYLSDVVVGTPTRDGKRLAEAVAALQRAAELEPGDAETRFWLGQAHAFAGEKELALEQYTVAIELAPDHGMAHTRTGIVLGELGRAPEALEVLRRAVELQPADAATWFQYGLQLEQTGDTAGALAAYQRSVELDWSVPGTYARLASALRIAGDPEGAKAAVGAFRQWTEYGSTVKQLLRTVNADRSDPELHVELARAYVRGHLFDYARPFLVRALRLDPENRDAQELLDWIDAQEENPVAEDTARFRTPLAVEDSQR